MKSIASIRFIRSLFRLRTFLLYRKKIGLKNVLTILHYKVFCKEGVLVPIKLKHRHVFYLRNRTYDVRIFSQLFIYDELNFSLDRMPATILDCGANIGLATLYFHFKYPHAKIISVEPENENFRLLSKNTAAFKNIEIIKGGIWNKSCSLFLIDEGNGNASFKVTEQETDQNVIGEVRAFCIGEIMNAYNIEEVDLLKMDIEGSEYACFSNNAEHWIGKTKCLAVEIHESLNPGCKELIDNALSTFNCQLNGEYYVYTVSSQS